MRHNIGKLAYLEGAVFLQGNTPVLVHSARSDQEIHVSELGDRDREVSTIPLQSLNLNPPKLGYMNSRGRARYLVRIPSRNWRQGITNRNTQELSWTTSDFPRFRSVSVTEDHVKGLKLMLQNDYPSIPYAMEALSRGDCSEIALSKVLCLDSNLNLLYKGRSIGSFANEQISLLEHFQHMLTMVEDTLNV